MKTIKKENLTTGSYYLVFVPAWNPSGYSVGLYNEDNKFYSEDLDEYTR